MNDTIDTRSWMNALAKDLQGSFGERLTFVGLQGSRARDEARSDSDIDVVVIIDGLSATDLETYKALINDRSHGDIACGFVSAPDVLANWPRYDSFNLVMDTTPFFGTLDFMDVAFDAQDAIASAEAGASGIYHAVCHGLLFDDDMLEGIVSECVKSSFFIMCALAYARTGEYPASRKRMKELASEDELAFLRAYDEPSKYDAKELATKLMLWTESLLTR